jgi:hypothetical protein
MRKMFSAIFRYPTEQHTSDKSKILCMMVMEYVEKLTKLIILNGEIMSLKATDLLSIKMAVSMMASLKRVEQMASDTKNWQLVAHFMKANSKMARGTVMEFILGVMVLNSKEILMKEKSKAKEYTNVQKLASC